MEGGADPDADTLHGGQRALLFRYSVGGGHDLDQDEWPDLAIGDPYNDCSQLPGHNVGRIFVPWGVLR